MLVCTFRQPIREFIPLLSMDNSLEFHHFLNTNHDFLAF